MKPNSEANQIIFCKSLLLSTQLMLTLIHALKITVHCIRLSTQEVISGAGENQAIAGQTRARVWIGCDGCHEKYR